MNEINKAFSMLDKESIKKALEDINKSAEDLIIYNIDGKGFDFREITVDKVLKEFKKL